MLAQSPSGSVSRRRSSRPRYHASGGRRSGLKKKAPAKLWTAREHRDDESPSTLLRGRYQINESITRRRTRYVFGVDLQSRNPVKKRIAVIPYWDLKTWEAHIKIYQNCRGQYIASMCNSWREPAVDRKGEEGTNPLAYIVVDPGSTVTLASSIANAAEIDSRHREALVDLAASMQYLWSCGYRVTVPLACDVVQSGRKRDGSSGQRKKWQLLRLCSVCEREPTATQQLGQSSRKTAQAWPKTVEIESPLFCTPSAADLVMNTPASSLFEQLESGAELHIGQLVLALFSLHPALTGRGYRECREIIDQNLLEEFTIDEYDRHFVNVLRSILEEQTTTPTKLKRRMSKLASLLLQWSSLAYEEAQTARPLPRHLLHLQTT